MPQRSAAPVPRVPLSRSRLVLRSPDPPLTHSPFFPPPLSRSFYLRPTLTVARDLLGKLLVRTSGEQVLVGRIVEVEAYLGSRDPASHAYRGKTRRNAVMFSEGGHLYVYFTYGMHFCCNVVTEREGIGHAVLLRAIEPLSGIETMAKNRNATLQVRKNEEGMALRRMVELTNGPAKLCQALGIRRKENGVDLCAGPIWIADDATSGRFGTGRSSRIGIRRGREHAWRFYVKGNPFVSPGKPSARPGARAVRTG
jgi:DNA-3-methyladenine glycosylase